MNKVSAYILTKNEEKRIKDCIESIKWVDEIVVIDDFSSDNTVKIAKSLGCKVVQNKFEYFGKQRNFALKHCTYQWVICLDADERVSQELKKEIESTLQGYLKFDVYVAPRKSRFINKWIMHSGWYPDYRHPILFNKSKVIYKDQLVHEDIDYKGKPFYFKGDILHYPYDSIKSFINKSDFYSDLRSKEMFQKGKKFKVVNLIVNPAFMFFKMYISKRGFLDGITGLVLALLYSSFYTLMKYVKLWELENK
ncbi:MAG: glycosyltransferase family 2 protein [Endomicrobium sp.]|jgi:glycosyltransferase involved in cell wall biosynthesis|uniref:glycosyltransferase family 2 protein n=1 Tax=Candidatus Endomicrobiellum cubanum TaxID=3242325 RepID=UPI0028267A84|nr:glycosyltransferase family 2 protein [Endomicrobium sp.]MDR2396083.1 glycosyltransferase family 2 protein [Endomicrobium sp.]